ncbi:hypothetical protein [Magnetospirillum moscoviense]|uniref:Uncharacterized protein n=1 Tax=Magnetospirillum moscoviense TaxID=1437059 RepID=A0A178MF36_9PROT|nr:hypothetical protein [Magnetospirillum moscoviense]OAN47136.1 hypothetical protein A6A05_15830 [Magnetospirillum moscoviense]
MLAEFMAARALAGLAHPDLTEDFRTILAGPNGTTLGIVLDALAEGTPLPDLADDLLALILDGAWPVLVRKEAVTAFAHASPDRSGDLVSVLAWWRFRERMGGVSLGDEFSRVLLRRPAEQPAAPPSTACSASLMAIPALPIRWGG